MCKNGRVWEEKELYIAALCQIFTVGSFKKKPWKYWWEEY